MSTLETDFQLEVVNLTSTLLQEVEAQVLAQAMQKSRFNQSEVARKLGISRGALRYKLKEHFGDMFVGSRS